MGRQNGITIQQRSLRTKRNTSRHPTARRVIRGKVLPPNNSEVIQGARTKKASTTKPMNNFCAVKFCMS
ncbi:MAG: hypothetical protein EBU36_05770 [Verrucomicrobia bacterium]|nr:hypothetical protein [Verrucomicrobiota bacterium]